ncbi:hypothetical protein [Methylomonas sp. MgM2]
MFKKIDCAAERKVFSESIGANGNKRRRLAFRNFRRQMLIDHASFGFK